MIKTAIFDLDGTLTDTIEDLADAVNFGLSFYGLPTHPVEAFKYFIGTGSKNLIRKAAPKDIDSETFNKVYDKYYGYYSEHFLDKTVVYDKTLEMLDALREKGIKLAVCSNKPHQMTERVVEALLPNRFSLVQGQSDSFPIKPDPAVVNYIIEKHGTVPEETLFIGDSGVDMQTAKNSGCIGVGVSWGLRTVEELKENGADFIADSPLDILKIIEKV